MLAAAADALSRVAGGHVRLEDAAVLRSGPRTLVLRTRVSAETGLPTSVIVKAPCTTGRGPRRSASRPGSACSPRTSSDPRSRPSCWPWPTTRRWSSCATCRRPGLREIWPRCSWVPTRWPPRTACSPGPTPWAGCTSPPRAAGTRCPTPSRRRPGGSGGTRPRPTRRPTPSTGPPPPDLLPRLDVIPSASALAEIRHLQDGFGGDDRCWALTPGDTCPDNNVLTEAGVVLFDFEAAAIRHLAWDAAYLRVPWPSCWCAWRLPEDVARRPVAEAAWVRSTWNSPRPSAGARADPYGRFHPDLGGRPGRQVGPFGSAHRLQCTARFTDP